MNAPTDLYMHPSLHTFMHVRLQMPIHNIVQCVHVNICMMSNACIHCESDMPIIVWCDLLKCRRMNPPEIDEISILAIPQPAQALQVLRSQCCGTIPGGARHLRIRLCFPISNSITTICL